MKDLTLKRPVVTSLRTWLQIDAQASGRISLAR